MTLCQVCLNNAPTTHKHHILMQEFGGKGTLTINICPSCHDAIHRSATNPEIYDLFIASLPPNSIKIAKILVAMIRNAPDLGNKEPYVKLSIVIPREVHSRLKAISGSMSMQDFVCKVLSKLAGVN